MNFKSIAPIGWQYQAADNLKHVFSNSLEREPVERLAGHIRKVFIDLRQYNEQIRTNEGIPPEVKVWLVVP